MTVVLVALGGVVGASLRLLLADRISERIESRYPWAILAINLSGTLLLGLLTGLDLHHHLPSDVGPLVGTGFCGAYTTFSTFTFETMVLVERGQYRLAITNVATSLSLGLGAAALGVELGLCWS